jgi:hypothetical protein
LSRDVPSHRATAGRAGLLAKQSIDRRTGQANGTGNTGGFHPIGMIPLDRLHLLLAYANPPPLGTASPLDPISPCDCLPVPDQFGVDKLPTMYLAVALHTKRQGSSSPFGLWHNMVGMGGGLAALKTTLGFHALE